MKTAIQKLRRAIRRTIRFNHDAEELFAQRINIIRARDQEMIFGTLNYNIEKFLDIAYRIDEQCYYAYFLDKVHGVVYCEPLMVGGILERYKILEKDGHIFNKKPLIDCLKTIRTCI